MFRFLFLFLVFAGGFAFFPTGSFKAQSGPVRPIENPYLNRSPEVERRNELIWGELEKLKNHPWAGKYFMGRGLGTRRWLRLAPEAGFTFTSGGCVRDFYYLDYGSVKWSKGKIRLHPATQPLGDESSFERFRVFYPVKWGDRRYLISEDEMIVFINQINQGDEPSENIPGNRFFLHEDDMKKKVFGSPGLPPQFREYLLKRPIHAAIIAIGKTEISKDEGLEDSFFRDTEITLNVGSAQGVLEGMEFLGSGSNSHVSAVVTKVDMNSCTAIVTEVLSEDEKSLALPAPGWEFSTSRKD